MEYKSSLDLLAKVITAAAIIILAAVSYASFKELLAADGDMTTILIRSGIILLSALILLVCYWLSPRKYFVDNKELVIERPAKDVHILISDIEEVRPVVKGEMRWTIRTFGVGGLFGYYGKYYNSTFGSMTWYTTQLKNRVLIQTKSGKKIIITPDDITFSDTLKSKLKLLEQSRT